MDKDNGILSIERGGSQFAGFRLLKRIDPQTLTAEDLERLWAHIEESEESADDFTRGNIDYFLAQLTNPANEFYEVEDSVLVMLLGIVERGACNIHYLTWNREWGLAGFRHIVKEVLDYLFYARKVHHVVGYIPACHHQAIRFALSAGLKFEGEIREDSLYHGTYYATHIYGMLDREYEGARGRL